MFRPVDYYTLNDLRILAQGAKKARNEVPDDNVSLNSCPDFFPPPVCDVAEERFSNVLALSKRRGNEMIWKRNVVARIEHRAVRGLRLWESDAPDSVEADVIIKNPDAINELPSGRFVGARNVLMIYGGNGDITPRAFLGALTKKGVYVIRPAIEEFQNSLIRTAKKRLK